MKILLPELTNGSSALVDLCSTNTSHTIVPLKHETPHEIESCKSKAYNLFRLHGIPIPECKIFSSIEELLKDLPEQYPYVVKAEGVHTPDVRTIVIHSSRDLKQLIELKLSLETNISLFLVDSNPFLLTQQFVQGYEYTVIVLMNNKNWQRVGSANDYKKMFNNDVGVNTVGMGSIYPVRQEHPSTDSIIDKVVNAMQETYPDYKGFLSCQFIVDQNNQIWLLETNSRVCDPEFQSISTSLDNTIADRIAECYSGEYIDKIIPNPINAVTISLLHRDWPNVSYTEYMKAPTSDNFKIYDTSLLHGSRIGHITITNSGNRPHKILANEIYQWLEKIDTTNFYYRTDIGT
jgi:phosphoribosylamine--glycine ligase